VSESEDLMHFGAASLPDASPAWRSTFSSASTPSLGLAIAFQNVGSPAYNRKNPTLLQHRFNRAARVGGPLPSASCILGSATSVNEERHDGRATALEDRLKILEGKIREKTSHNIVQTPSLVPVKLLMRLVYTVSLQFLGLVSFALRAFTAIFNPFFDESKGRDKKIQRKQPLSQISAVSGDAEDEEKNNEISVSSGAVDSEAHAATDTPDGTNDEEGVLQMPASPSSGSEQEPETVYLASASMEDLRATVYGGLQASQQGIFAPL
jgi:hypothetical protein